MIQHPTAKRISMWILMVLSVTVTGCGDSPDTLFHEFNSLQNELADVLVLVSDEESAKKYLETKLEKLWAKSEDLKHRADKIFEIEDEKVEEAALLARINTIDENVVGSWRVSEQVYRITEIRYQLFIEEMLNRQKKGVLPNCIDEEMFTLFQSRILIPTDPDFAKFQDEMREKVNELLQSSDPLPPVVMAVVAVGQDAGPKAVLVDLPRYKYYLQQKGSKYQVPVSFAVRKPTQITSTSVSTLLASRTKAWEDNKKQGPAPTATQAFEDLAFAAESETPVVILDPSGRYSLANDSNPSIQNKNTPGFHLFFDEGLSNQFYAKQYMPTQEYNINAGNLWPSLTELTGADEKLSVTDIWKNDPLSQTASSSGGMGMGGGPGGDPSGGPGGDPGIDPGAMP